MKILSSKLSELPISNIMETLMFEDIEWEQSEVMNNWDKYGLIYKDIFKGEIFKVKNLGSVGDKFFLLQSENGINLMCNIKKEKKFFEIHDYSFENLEDFVNWLKSEEAKQWFFTNEIYVQCTNIQKGIPIGSLLEAQIDYQKEEFLKEIKNPQKVYKAYIKDKNLGGFIAVVNGVDTFLPGSLAAANKIIDFDSFVGKTVYVMFEDYIKDGDTFIVSNKKYIEHILPEKIKTLKFDKIYKGEVTGTSKFGIFIEFDKIFTGLLHISEMTELTKNRFKEGQFVPGDNIEFYIKEISKNNRIILSETPQSSNSITIDQFKEQFEGKVIPGKVLSIKPYGFFIKFTIEDSSFIGLLYIKEVINKNLKIGDTVECYINQVDIETKKIFLKQNIND